MRIEIGHYQDSWGYVYWSQGHSLRYEGPHADLVQAVVEDMRVTGMSDEAVFRSLPQRLQHYDWASLITNDDGSPLPDKNEARGVVDRGP